MGRQQASKVYKTKRTVRAPDTILNADLVSADVLAAKKNQKFDEYLPGLGQNYCVPCAKHYESETALTTHTKSKVHKRQLKALREGPYTVEEGIAAGGQDVEKFLRKKREQDALLAESHVVTELTAQRANAHLKSHTDGTMDVEQTEQTELENNDTDLKAETEPVSVDISV